MTHRSPTIDPAEVGVPPFRSRWLRQGLVPDLAALLSALGLAIALAVTFVPVLFGDPLMTHYPRAGEHARHIGSLELITPVPFDVGVFLLVLGFAIGAIDLIARSIERGRA